MEALIIVFVIYILVAGILSFLTRSQPVLSIIFLSATISFALSFMSTIIILDDVPSAMDVYQEKTVLKYTIVGGVKVDSCVVFKLNN